MYWPFLKYRILSSSATELSEIYEVEEGIENRLIESAKQSSSFQQFMTLSKTKRYTWTRIQRICIHILTHSRKKELEPHSFPSYIRLLGMNEIGQKYLQEVKKELSLPFISKVSAYNDPAIQTDLRAASIFAQGLSEPYQSELLKREFTAPIIRKTVRLLKIAKKLSHKSMSSDCKDSFLILNCLWLERFTACIFRLICFF